MVGLSQCLVTPGHCSSPAPGRQVWSVNTLSTVSHCSGNAVRLRSGLKTLKDAQDIERQRPLLHYVNRERKGEKKKEKKKRGTKKKKKKKKKKEKRKKREREKKKKGGGG